MLAILSNKRSYWAAIMTLVAFFYITPSFQPVYGQEAEQKAEASSESKENAAEEPEEDAAADALAEAGKFHLGDDPTVWVMLAIAALALLVTLERIWVLRANAGHNKELVKMITDVLSSRSSNNDIEELADTISKKRYGMEGRVAAVTLKGWPFGESTMREYAHAALTAEKRSLDKRLVILSTLGNNTPFIGLLGTVLGIMKAFRDLSASGGGPEVVMKGISEALIATAMGLGVAIPVVIAFNALATAVKNKVSNAEEISTILQAIRLSKDVSDVDEVLSKDFKKSMEQRPESAQDQI